MNIHCGVAELRNIIPYLQAEGIGFVAYSPLGRGFFADNFSLQASQEDVRHYLPRFQGDNLTANQKSISGNP